MAASAGTGSRAASRRASSGEKTLFGVPARFMRPRLVLVAVTLMLVGFGLLMVYSASSVSALSDPDIADGAYYLKKQLAFAAFGAVAAVLLAVVDYRFWCRKLLLPIWVLTAVLLLAVIAAGTDNGMGATRWVELAGFQLQPSEFAKLTIVFTAANVCEAYFDEGSIDWNRFLTLLALGVGLPLLLIVLQPDKGTTMVLGVTLVTMGYLAGVPKHLLAGLLLVGLVGFLALSLKDDYSRARLVAMINPWADPYDGGYHLIQGFYAFGSGGLFGVGIGFSRQKYSYLPMAHNDFIFAIIGEECGLVGTLGLLAGFTAFAWAGFRIARYAPDLLGRLVAAGCTSLVIVQLMLNVSGVLGVFPLSGKPIPFVSYGGSSIMASLMIVGMIASVSLHSRLPETAHDSARRSWRTESGRGDGGAAGAFEPPFSLVDEAQPPSRPRGARRDAGSAGRGAQRADARSASGRAGFTVVDGGGRRATRAPGGARGRATTDGRGRRRIDLGPSASERLRGGSGPRTR